MHQEQGNDTNNNEKKACLKYLHALGLRGHGISSPVVQHLNDDENIVYLVGQHVALYNYEKRTHRFFLKSPKTSRINSFVLSPNRKYITLCETVYKKILDPEGVEKAIINNQLTIYNFSKATKYRSLQFADREIISFCWSKDCKYFVVAVRNEIMLYSLEKMKKIASKTFNHTLDSISMNPFSQWQISSTGSEDLKVWRFTENELKSFDPLFKSNNELSNSMIENASRKYSFTCHIWFDDEKLLVGTEEGVILIVDGLYVVKEIHDIQPSHIAGGILTICSVDRGFICGGENGYMSVFERTYDTEYFNHYKRFRSSNNRKESIIGLCVSKKEESLIVTYEDNQIAHFSLANVDILKENANDNFTYLPISFHDYFFSRQPIASLEPVNTVITGSIGNSSPDLSASYLLPKHFNTGNLHQQVQYGCLSSDTCVQKSILASVSGRTLRIYNYRRRCLELSQTFSEETLSVSLCPTGFRILISFRFKLCLFNIEKDKLSLTCSWQLKNITHVQFHGSGDRFLAVSSNNILIISALTFKLLKTLRGHSGLVKGAQWSRLSDDINGQDYRLVSVGHEGAKYEWTVASSSTIQYIQTFLLYHSNKENGSIAMYSNLQSMPAKVMSALESGKISENIVKQCTFKSCDFDGELGIALVVGNDRTIYSFKDNEWYSKFLIEEFDLTFVRISPICALYFIGTSCGKVLMGNWPPLQAPYAQYELHLGPICSMTLSTDEQFLMSLGADGSMFIMTISTFEKDKNDKDGTGKIENQTAEKSISEGITATTLDTTEKNTRLFDYALMQDLFIVHGPTIDELENAIKNLTLKLAQQKSDYEREKEKLEIQNEEALKKERNKTKELQAEWTTRYNELKQRLMEEQSKANEKIQLIEQSKVHSEQLANEALVKTESAAHSRLEQLKIMKDGQVSDLLDTIRKLKDEHEKELSQLKEKYENERYSQNHLLEQLGNQYTKLNELFEKTQQEVEKDFEKELQKTKKELHDEIKICKKQIAEEKAKAGTFSNNAEMHGRKLKEMEIKYQEQSNKLRKTEKNMEEDKQQIKDLESERDDKDERILSLEKKLQDLTKQAEELEKLRFVLTFKFNRLSGEVAPKEELIKTMRDDLKAKDNELQKVKRIMDAMQGRFESKNEKAEALNKQIQKYRQQYEEKNRLFEQMISHLSKICFTSDSKQCMILLRKFVSQYKSVMKNGQALEQSSRDQIEEFGKQREFLEQQMNTMKKFVEQRQIQSNYELMKRNSENSSLVEEVNALRKELKKQKQKTQSLKLQLRNSMIQSSNYAESLVNPEDFDIDNEKSTNSRRTSTPLGTRVSFNNRPKSSYTRGSSSNGTNTSSVITRVRTPDSFFSSGSNSSSCTAKKNRGSLMKGNTNALPTSIDRVKVKEFLEAIERNNRDFEKQQEEIGKLKQYVENLVNSQIEKEKKDEAGNL